MKQNPYAAPKATQHNIARLDAPIMIGGITSTRLAREVKEHFDGRPNFFTRYSAILWAIPAILVSLLLIYSETRKMPPSFSQVESLTAALAKHWYLMVGLLLYILFSVWVFFSQRINEEIEQTYTFTDDGIKIENENLSAEIPWKSVKCQNSDHRFIQFELAPPNSGEFVLDRTWCENESDWNLLCQFLQCKFSD